MPQSYFAIKCREDPESVLKKVERLLSVTDRDKQVLAVFPGTFVKRDDFYLYIETATRQRDCTPPVLRELSQALSTPEPIPCNSPKDQQPVHEAREKWRKRTEGRVIYRSPQEARYALPYDAWSTEDQDTQTNEEQTLVNTEQYDHLLLLLSAYGEGHWDRFCQLCHALGSDESRYSPARVLRQLHRLGHVAVAPDRSQWRTIGPMLVALPNSENASEITTRYLLCGARDATLLEALRLLGQVEHVPQPRGQGPAAVFLEATPEALGSSTYKPVLTDVLVVHDPMLYVNSLPALDVWRSNLPAEDIPTFEYEVRLFDGTHFTPRVFEEAAGLYEFWSRPSSPNGPQTRVKTRYYDATARVWRSGDWYDLRFLSHADRLSECCCYYAPAARRLTISKDWRLPLLYERALILASGYLPEEQGHFLCYSGVTQALVECLNERLPLSLQYIE